MLNHIKKLNKKQLISTFLGVIAILIFGILVFNGTITGQTIQKAIYQQSSPTENLGNSITGQIVNSCSDTDKTNSVYKKSSVTKNGKTYYDKCYGNKRVREYYCSGTKLKSVKKYCPTNYKCKNGACVEKITECKETGDSGVDIYNAGIVTYKKHTFPDFCYAAGGVLEFSCSSADKLVINYKFCPYSYKCENGACIRK